MQEIQYIGEHLMPGWVGHFLVVLAWVLAMLSAVSYALATKGLPEKAGGLTWRQLGRWSFLGHTWSILGVIGTLFYIMLSQYYEYRYAQEHVSADLDFKYIFSAFWEGQEGSFLLWMFWNSVLGVVLMGTAGEWEKPVVSVIATVQVFLVSMILGLYFHHGDTFTKIGSSPFALLRNVMLDAPIFAQPDYLSKITGNGLNPLLQNWWMTIHPPTLFLGFSSTVVPFAFAVAALATRQYKSWLNVVLPWALFSGAILGLGILMGGAWAYEALSFGGYWAWDPVENMSLVPWIVLVAGIHGVLVARATGHSLRATFVLFILSFGLILYSTFLTRSGVLGDTSVHAFTKMGLEWQLIIFMAVVGLLGLYFFVSRYRQIPTIVKEEHISSREFWMFIGMVVLMLSAVLITFTTSIPVYNKVVEWVAPKIGLQAEQIANLLRRPPNNPVEHYNKYQLWVAFFVATLSGCALLLGYRTQQNKTVRIQLLGIAVVATLLTTINAYFAQFSSWQYVALLWAGWFSIAASTFYVVRYIQGNPKLAGAALAHLGFGILCIGVLYSGDKKEVISRGFMSVGTIEGFNAEDTRKNLLLKKNLPTEMLDYTITYTADSTNGRNRTYFIEFVKKDTATHQVVESYTLTPNVLYNKAFTKIETTNPSTKHYLTKDIFTHLSALPPSQMEPAKAQAAEDTLTYKPHEIAQGDTLFTSQHYIVFEGFNMEPTHPQYQPQSGDIAIAAKLAIHTLHSDSITYAQPMYLIRENIGVGYDAPLKTLGLYFRFAHIDPTKRTITIDLAETKPLHDYIVLQAIIFPYINLVWLGSLLSIFGLAISALYKYRQYRDQPTASTPS
jgi:cytochrome c-type biogenesis protein CcmF